MILKLWVLENAAHFGLLPLFISFRLRGIDMYLFAQRRLDTIFIFHSFFGFFFLARPELSADPAWLVDSFGLDDDGQTFQTF